MLKNFLLAGLGGMAGTLLRYAAGFLFKNSLFPFSTFLVNIVGCLLIGMVYGMSMKHPDYPMHWKLFLATGICGGFTTFSAFTIEGLQMLQQQRYLVFFLYFALSIILGLVAALLGIKLMG